MSGMVPEVRAIPAIAGVWKGLLARDVPALPTGCTALDAVLPGGGWPLGQLIELMPSAEGIGELRLLMPVLRQLASAGRRIVFVGPPYLLYPPALAQTGLPLSKVIHIATGNDEEHRWTVEQVLRAGCAGAVVLWSPVTADLSLRRLQIAGSEGRSLAFLYRPMRSLALPSPASVRLGLHAAPMGLRIEVEKSRGGRAGRSVLLPMPRSLS